MQCFFLTVLLENSVLSLTERMLCVSKDQSLLIEKDFSIEKGNFPDQEWDLLFIKSANVFTVRDMFL